MFARFFVDRPIFATVLSIVIVIVGLVALIRLPIASYPDVTPPTVNVTTVYPGANAVDVAEKVATPIEQQVNGVEGMIYMLSRCSNDGTMSLDITFKPGINLDFAQVLVQNRVNIAQAKLPEEVKRQGVTTKKRSPNFLLAINLISVKEKDEKTGNEKYKFDQLYLSNFATLNLKDALARIEGVGDVFFLGPRDYSMRVWLDPDKVASLGLTPAEVVLALRTQNQQVAAGRINQPPAPTGQAFQYPINVPATLVTEKQFEDVIIKSAGGKIVYLKEVVRDAKGIELGAQNYDVNSYLDGQPSVAIGIFQLPGSNALDAAKAIRKLMADFKAANVLPHGMEYKIVYDTTLFIEESVGEVYKTLFEAFVLVFIVVLVFLQDWRATLLPMIDVPVSLIGTFAVMAALGFSINNLTLFGLVLAIGIVVDDAIVVVENIERWMSKGLPPREATIKAMDEITGPVIAITLVLSSVFIPTAFLAGISGAFYRQFALTIAASTIISAVNALTMAPARAVTLIKPHTKEHAHQREALPRLGVALLAGFLVYYFVAPELGSRLGIVAPGSNDEVAAETSLAALWGLRLGLFAVGGVVGWFLSPLLNFVLLKFFDGFNRVFGFITTGYSRMVASFIRVSAIVLFIYGGLLVCTYGMSHIVPVGFVPEQDKGYLVVNVSLPDGASLERTDKITTDVAALARGIEGVDHDLAIPGFSIFSGTNLSYNGGMFVVMEPFEKRKYDPTRSSKVIESKLQKLYAEKILEANVAVFGPPPVEGIGNTGGFKLQIEDKGAGGPEKLQGAVTNLIEAGFKQPGFLALFTSYSANQPQIKAPVDKELAKARDVPLEAIYDTLGVYFGSAYVNDFTRFGRNWQVIVQADPKFRSEINLLSRLKVKNSKGDMVSLEAFINPQYVTGPAIVYHYNMYPSADVMGMTKPGTSSGDAIDIMNALGKKELPPGMGFEWSELSYQEIEAGKDPLSPLIFPLSVLFVFLVLAALYESWSLPLAIILIVPMCVLCALTGVFLAGLDNNIFTQIGLVVLIGLAAKNAILIVEFARDAQREGKTRFDAAVEAARTRFRPILMTSFAFILGVVPLVLSRGAGSEMRVALGVAVFSGMLGVTLFGVFFTPVFYVVIRRFVEGRKPGDRRGVSPPVSGAGPAAAPTDGSSAPTRPLPP